MAKLLFTLPPLAPDYSGIASVFHDTGALVVIHDASGCTGTYTGYDEPRWFGSDTAVFCSGLREMDAIMGDDEKLAANIAAALATRRRPPCIALVGSPVPMVIGFDFAGVAALIEQRTGVPCLAFPANGIAHYDTGQKAAYLAIARKFLPVGEAAGRPHGGAVNLLGVSPLDGFDDDALDALLALLAENGLPAGAVWGMRSTLAQLQQSGAGNGAANWVVSAAALPLARYLHDTFGTPFVAGVPQCA